MDRPPLCPALPMLGTSRTREPCMNPPTYTSPIPPHSKALSDVAKETGTAPRKPDPGLHDNLSQLTRSHLLVMSPEP